MGTGAPLGGLVLIAAIVVWAASPTKWQTFKKMALAFVATLIVGIAVGFAVGYLYSSPQLTGAATEASVYLSFLVSAIMGWQHVRLTKSKSIAPHSPQEK